MSDQMFVIEANRDLQMLRITLRGFWNASTMAAYMKAVRRGMGELQGVGAFKRIFIDMCDFPIQSREIAEAHAANLHFVKKTIGGIKVALATQQGMSRLQASRVAADTGYETFSTAEEALDWLLRPNPGP